MPDNVMIGILEAIAKDIGNLNVKPIFNRLAKLFEQHGSFPHLELFLGTLEQERVLIQFLPVEFGVQVPRKFVIKDLKGLIGFLWAQKAWKQK